VLRETEARGFFLENVPGIIIPNRGTGSRAPIVGILEDLAEDGFDAEGGVFSASEVGASHKRQRVFLLAYRNKSRSKRRLSGGRKDDDAKPLVLDRGTVADAKRSIDERRSGRGESSGTAEASCGDSQQRENGPEHSGSYGTMGYSSGDNGRPIVGGHGKQSAIGREPEPWDQRSSKAMDRMESSRSGDRSGIWLAVSGESAIWERFGPFAHC